MTTRFSLNGQPTITDTPPWHRVSDVLRNHLGLMGTKVGCDAGDCGACTILADGEPVCGCMTSIAQIEGLEIETVEGIAANGNLSRLQEAFLHHGAAQCGICTPGMLVAATALLRTTPHPTRNEVEDALGGVLCRCTGYKKIVDAVMTATGFNGLASEPGAGQGIGAPIRRLDGIPKVDGSERYGADAIPSNALWVRVVRCPYPRARFEFGDLDDFVDATPGISAILTAADIPGTNMHGVIPAFVDQPVFAENVARYRGEAIAALVGEMTAVRAFRDDDFPATWEELDAAETPVEALSPDAPQLHDDRPGNILIEGYVARGDVEAGFSSSAHTVEAHFTTPFVEHAYIEPEAGWAVRKGDRIELHGCTQAPVMDKEGLEDILGLARGAVRIIPTACGGGFGSKLDISMQPYIALAAWKLKRPAAIVYTRAESMQSTTKRHPSEITLRAGCDSEGRIMSFDFEGCFNTGAYASWGPTVANRVPVHASGPYFTPNYRARGKAVLTNGPPAGAFRGFGVPQAAIAQESVYDVLAERAGIDRLAFRRINALEDGQSTVTGQVFERGVGIAACLDALKPAWDRALKAANDRNQKANGAQRRYGVGIASCWYGCGNTSLPNPSTIRIGIRPDGQIYLHQGASDIGQGANTVIAQIAADALGVPVHTLNLVGPDTDLTPDCGKTSASRQTYVTGSAAKRAGEALRTKILRSANISASAEISIIGSSANFREGKIETAVDLSAMPTNEHGYVLMAEETYDPPTTPLDDDGQGNPYAVFGYGAQVVELSVDTGLGTVELEKITAAHDVGRAINPVLIEGQIEGGIAQGIGMALMEEYIPGRTENLHDYLIPTFGDIPEIESLVIEVPDMEGPFGAKGLGEHVLIPTAPAILNAIRHATGAEVRHLPATPDKVRAAIKKAGSGNG